MQLITSSFNHIMRLTAEFWMMMQPLITFVKVEILFGLIPICLSMYMYSTCMYLTCINSVNLMKEITPWTPNICLYYGDTYSCEGRVKKYWHLINFIHKSRNGIFLMKDRERERQIAMERRKAEIQKMKDRDRERESSVFIQSLLQMMKWQHILAFF